MALNTQVPEWLVNQEQWQREDASRSSAALVQDWFEGQKLGMERQKNLLSMQSGLLSIQQQKQNLDMGQVKLRGLAMDQETVPPWMQKYYTEELRQTPEAQASKPITHSDWGAKQLDQLSIQDSRSLQQKIAVAGVSEFTKRVTELGKSDPIAAAQFAQTIGKVPTPTILQALGVAEQAAALRQQNEKEQAALDAQARGDVQTTRITEKGVTQEFKPAPPSGKDTTPKTMTLDGGATLAWVPGGKTLHVINPVSKKKTVMTPAQLLSVANGLKDTDPRKKQIQDFLANKAVGEMTNDTPAAAAPAAPPAQPVRKYNPQTGLIE